MAAPKREEMNDVVHYLLPSLRSVGIKQENCKVDTTTGQTGRQRGDVWISGVDQAAANFEKKIVALIEAKHRKCEIGDIDWRDAMQQGREKSEKHGLTFYIVTNCHEYRYYNGFTDEEIVLDGSVVTRLQSLDVLERMQAQVSPENCSVYYKTSASTVPASESKFRKSLERLADVYRSCGLKKGDERIDPTVAFVVLKYIGENELQQRTLGSEVRIWPDFGQSNGNYRGDFIQAKGDIFGGLYGDSYKDFKELVRFPEEKLMNEHYKQIYGELNQFHFHGCNFDVFGAIYEEFASQTKKKEFGEFYTRRHITGLVARLLLRNEVTGRDLKICDPACGTGGFLTEAYRALMNNYSANGKLNQAVQHQLKHHTFWGYDNDETSVARTKLNMFLIGDGHTNIAHLKDSLIGWRPQVGWKENEFDYVLANPPMGPYSGEAKISSFLFTNERRCEMLFAEQIIKATKPGNEMAIVVPDGLLEAPSREGIRQKLLDHCDIKCVVSLTRFAFAPYTKEKTYILFMRKKQADEVGNRQKHPIWHFVVDYDGFANSDKRFKTKWHDDLPELEDKFPMAMDLLRLSGSNPVLFESMKRECERPVNNRELDEGLNGHKYGFVDIDKVGPSNFHNLLSEHYLRPLEDLWLSDELFDQTAAGLMEDAKKLLQGLT